MLFLENIANLQRGIPYKLVGLSLSSKDTMMGGELQADFEIWDAA